VDEAEIRELKWWSRHHEESVKFLLYRIEQMLDGDDIEGIMRATVEGFRQTYPKK
tara:strand:+ start:117 stop:281 length:165 start_codon:yes stop_codon:yes gene_type:complete